MTASLSALLRSIVHSLTSDIEKMSSQETVVYRRLSKCLNALMVMARITWLMQSRISSLRRMFSSVNFDKIDRKAILSSFSQNFSFSSYQIKSAFDIADTDGDGLLSHKEYLEVENMQIFLYIFLYCLNSLCYDRVCTLWGSPN